MHHKRRTETIVNVKNRTTHGVRTFDAERQFNEPHKGNRLAI